MSFGCVFLHPCAPLSHTTQYVVVELEEEEEEEEEKVAMKGPLTLDHFR